MLPPIRADGKRRADAVSAPVDHGVAQEHHPVVRNAFVAGPGPEMERSRSDSTFMRRTAAGSNARSSRVRLVGASSSEEE